MPHLPPLVLAALTGFVSGFFLSIPVGPINLTILNEGARRGLLWALLIGFGATVMETAYCGLAFTGFATYFSQGAVRTAMELASFFFLLGLGIRFVRARAIEAVHRVEQRVEGRLHPHSAFMIGFVRVMGNPGVLLYWIVLASVFLARKWAPPTIEGKLACVAGVATGTFLWFASLGVIVSRGRNRLTEKMLQRMELASGLGLILLALANGVQIVLRLAAINKA
jgi:threonine/homoserine/homoserine lactone efflux protein